MLIDTVCYREYCIDMERGNHFSQTSHSMSIREMIEKLVAKGYYRAGVEALGEKNLMKLAKKENLI
jgi:hypothetical protein